MIVRLMILIPLWAVGTSAWSQSFADIGCRVFEERFQTRIDERAWDISWNGGKFQPWGGLAALNPGEDTTIFPYLLTKSDMLPQTGDWNLKVDFTVLRIGTYGNGFSLRNSNTGDELFRVHVDQTQGGIQLWLGSDKHVVHSGSAWNGQPIVVKVSKTLTANRWEVEKTGEKMTLVFNGFRLMTVTPESGTYVLRIGRDHNERMDSPGVWSGLAYGPVRIEYLTAAPPVWLK